MAKLVLVANWKNHPGSLLETGTLLRQLSRSSKLYKKLSFFIAPPLPYLQLVSLRVRNFANLATQDAPSMSQGTYTGMVTPDILKSFGVRLVILGHSECRALGETNEVVSQKVKITLRAGMVPLVCIGETFRDQDGEHFEFLREQLKLSLVGLNKKADISKLVVVYEPVWAIGKSAKDAIESADLSQTILFIRKVLADIFGRKVAERIPILYGGSVEPANVGRLSHETGIRGFLVGHASLDAKSLGAIAQSLIQK